MVSGAGAASGQPRPGLTAFVDVTVLPMDRPGVPHVLPHQTVLVRGPHVVELGPRAHVPVPRGATLVDGRGRYLLPGLANMHAHLQEGGGPDSIMPPRALVERMMLSLLAEGITTVRNMNGRPWHVTLRDQVARGELLGPRIYTAGPILLAGEVPLATPAEAAQTVRAQHAAGYDFLKVYGWGGSQAVAIFDSIVVTAARLHMPVAGHTPESIGLERMLQARVRSIEHFYGYLEPLTVAPDPDWLTTDRRGRLDDAEIIRLAQATRRAGVWNCPTLAVLSGARATAPGRLVRALHEAGAGLLPGTDGGPVMEHTPIVEELQAFVTAGLTPYEALETGTRNVAEFFGTLDSMGTVAVGKRADLVLIAGNPLEDVRAVAQPVGVMVGGRWLPRADLAARLARVGGPSGDTVVPPLLPPALALARAPLVLRGVTVIDVPTGRRLPDRTIVIAGTRIQALGPTGQVQVPPAAHVINARGQYLIPGLWDMHAHNAHGVFGGRRAASVLDAADRYAVYLAYGITGIRDMGTALPLDSLRIWRRAVAAGQRVGPRLVASGPYLDSEKPLGWGSLTATLPAALPVTSVAEARRAVDTLVAAGADLVKLHENTMAREIFFTIAAEARRRGIPFAGHLPQTVTMAEASDSGMRSIEHSWTFSGPCVQTDSTGAWPADSTGQAAKRACGALIAKFLHNGTWLSPNLITEDTIGDLRLLHAVRPFGLPFLVGTDIPVEGGEFDRRGAPLGVHHELALFVKAGLTPAQALRAATLNPALALGAADSLGTVARGKLADLVLLAADPLADIANTTKIRAVVANGRYYDRHALDALQPPATPAPATPASATPSGNP